MLSRFVTSFYCFAVLMVCSPSVQAQPFAIQVLDEGNQRGVPMAILETDNHIRLVTDSAGWVLFDEPGLMGRSLHFEVTSPGYHLPKDADGRSGIVFLAQPNQATEVKVVRTAIAERFYRITGQGAYRESTLLGKETPVPFPNINGDVLTVGNGQAAAYQGKLIWAWTTTQLSAHGLPIVSGAAVDLPGAGGLDPTQGVHFRYLTSEQEETLSLLPAKRGERTLLGGLISVPDAMGAEHLLVHYSFVDSAGQISEHGIAELNSQRLFDRKTVLGDEYTWQFPQGQATTITSAAGAFVYFAAPYCVTRAPATYEAAMSPASYEAFAWNATEERYEWQQERGPTSAADEKKLVTKKSMKAKDARYALKTALTEEALSLFEGSVQWNEFRKRWVLIGTAAGNEQTPGDVWYAEAAEPTGPWSKAVLVATHGGHAFKSIMQIPALAQEEGRCIYFAGTLSGGAAPIPRYQDNQLVYRLDLKDSRLK